ncbi:hypothetical protein CCHL11_02723 [Colletotrichum chlorophyti]|uniref:SUN domain-containing protein n=1 Tax=Colletotrichum chlorophyti TaxID=708187 RepID=A0A1Q8S2Z4_9PEZI|nr:hypothetical protein CCHL11_02723 [Colletotrichum chlorophyti]
MPPKRRVRGDDDDLPPVISRGGAAVTSNLPPLASRLDTSYGSAPSTILRNSRRGQRRDLQDMVKQALNDTDDSDDEVGRGDSNQGDTLPSSPKPLQPNPRSSRKAQPAPAPDPDSDPDSDPGFDVRSSSGSSQSSREPTPEPPLGHDSPQRNVPQKAAAPSAEPASFQRDPPASRQRLLPSAAPPKGPSPPIATIGTGRSSDLGPLFQPTREPPPFVPVNQLPPGAENSVFARAIAAGRATPGSVRSTFSQESSLFNAATFNSSSDSRQHTPVREEQENERAQQNALREQRNKRLQAWPRLYDIVYSWTHATRPDSAARSEDDPDDTEDSTRLPRMVPLDESSWFTWIMFKLSDGLVDFLNLLPSPKRWFIAVLLGVLVAILLGWSAISTPAGGIGGIRWYGISDFSHNLGQFLPLWMSQPSTMFGDEDTREYARRQRNHEYEISRLLKSSNIHDASLARLQEIVPKVVHMDVDKNGRPVVSQEFYHALRDLMKGDTEVLTMDRGYGGYHHISDEHWRAVRDRLREDPTYQRASSLQPGTSATEVENIFQSTFTKSWEKWLKNNNQKVAKILEPALDTSIPSMVEKNIQQKIEKVVEDKFKDKDSKDIVVTREEFIRHLQGEFATHRNEVKAEAQELQTKLERYIDDSVNAGLKSVPPAGISRAEMVQLADEMIRQAIANAGLEALARGQIGANWDSDLRHKVNYLTRGAGARIDVRRTAPIYKPPTKGKVGSQAWFKSLKNASPDAFEPYMTMFRWEDEGECWCGAVSTDREGFRQAVDITYQMSREIIPQHIVVEHILPGATLNPNARPRDIEVWAYITEVDARSRIEDFSAAYFPSSSAHNSKPREDGWIKIGQFTYESSDTQNGIYVHKLSSELLALRAVTDHILISMVNNHGADHTCLYRTRIFGEQQD